MGLHLECAIDPPPGATLELFLREDLPRATAERFLDDIQAEATGQLRNGAVRKFLRALPEGITRQVYQAYAGDQLLRRVEFGPAVVADVPDEAPRFLAMDGEVLGVSFDPAKPEVRLKTAFGNFTCSATLAQVERAVHLRKGFVSALAVASAKTRLLWIRPMDAATPLTDEDREQYLFGKWKGLLERLAK